jgi:hypothetical protein
MIRQSLIAVLRDAGGHNVLYGDDTGDVIHGDDDTGVETASDGADVILCDNGRIDRRLLAGQAVPVQYVPWVVARVCPARVVAGWAL